MNNDNGKRGIICEVNDDGKTFDIYDNITNAPIAKGISEEQMIQLFHKASLFMIEELSCER
jgi:hypothetical protein